MPSNPAARLGFMVGPAERAIRTGPPARRHWLVNEIAGF
jgi:hypothetical protein